MLDSGALKIMDSCVQLLKEVRTYRFDSNSPNEIAKNQEDHLCDALMYAICTFEAQCQSYAEVEEEMYRERNNRRDDSGDSQRSSITGY